MKVSQLQLLFVFCACAFFLALRSFHPIISRDLFWHLQIGLDFLNSGVFPFIDSYSILHQGKTIKHLSPPFEVLVAFFYNSFGLIGLPLAKAVIFLSTLLLFTLLWIRRNINLYVLSAGIILISAGLYYRSLLRPELLSLVFEIVFVILCLSLRDKFCWKRVFACLALIVFWVNMHGTSILGYLMFAGLCLDWAIKNIKNPSFLLKIVMIGLVAIGVGFLSPFSLHPVLGLFNLDSRWAQTTSELLRFDKHYFIYSSFVLVVLVSFPLFIFQKKWMELFVVTILAWKTWELNKLILHSQTMVVCLLMPSLSLIFQKNIRELKTQKKNAIALVCVLILLFGFYLEHRLANTRFISRGVLGEAAFPGEIFSDYFEKTKGESRKVFNEFGIGGYIIFRSKGEIKVIMDGRTNILYDYSHHLLNAEAGLREDTLLRMSDQYSIDYVIDKNIGVSQWTETALSSGKFGIEYFGDFFGVLKRGSNRFPISNKILFQPACYSQWTSKEIYEEREASLRSHKISGTIPRILNLAGEYLDTEDKINFLLNVRKFAVNRFDSRLISQFFRELEKFPHAIEMYSHLKKEDLTMQDLIFRSALLLQGGELAFKKSIEDLRFAVSFAKTLRPEEKEMLFNLLKDLNRKTEGRLMPDTALEIFKMNHKGKFNPESSLSALDIFSIYCDNKNDFGEKRKLVF